MRIASPSGVMYRAQRAGPFSLRRETTMMTIKVDRRTLLGGVAGFAAFGAVRARAASAPPLPSSPVALNVIDVAGQLQLTQAAMEGFAKANPKLISKIA